LEGGGGTLKKPAAKKVVSLESRGETPPRSITEKEIPVSAVQRKREVRGVLNTVSPSKNVR